MFEIEFTSKAELDLEWFRKSEQKEMLDAIEAQLQHQPTVETRNRFQLRPNQTAEWELRMGKFRVFYDVDDPAQIVSIEAVGFKVGHKLFFRGKESGL
jgi:mRNA-degrading endonuclease RelE of RelBE toxin-antitoxin system